MADTRDKALLVECVMIHALLRGEHDARHLSLRTVYVNDATGTLGIAAVAAQSPVTILVRESERTLPPIS